MSRVHEWRRLKGLLHSIEGMDGIEIPYNIIKHNLEPLKQWIKTRINELEENAI